MCSHFFNFQETLIEIKASSARTAVLIFLAEYVGKDQIDFEYQYLGKDIYGLIDTFGLEVKDFVSDEIT